MGRRAKQKKCDNSELVTSIEKNDGISCVNPEMGNKRVLRSSFRKGLFESQEVGSSSRVTFGDVLQVAGFIDPDHNGDHGHALENPCPVNGNLVESVLYADQCCDMGEEGRRQSWAEKVEEEIISEYGNDDKNPSSEVEVHQVTKPSEEKKWAHLFKDNRNPNKGSKLDFIAPKLYDDIPIVELTEDDYLPDLDFWANSAVGFVVGAKLSLRTLKNYVVENWKHVAVPKITPHPSGWVVFKFNSLNDRDDVVKGRPWMIGNRVLVMKPWGDVMQYQKMLLSENEIRVQQG